MPKSKAAIPRDAVRLDRAPQLSSRSSCSRLLAAPETHRARYLEREKTPIGTENDKGD